MRAPLAASTLLALALLPSAAHATYSIIAIDAEHDELGGAGTSCVGNLSLAQIFGFATGRGVVAAQAYINAAGRDRAVALLTQGQSASAAIDAITRADFDFLAGSRQYAVLDVDGGAAGYSGAQNQSFADDRQGKSGALSYSVQGNILTGVAVLDQAEDVFSAPGCDLADTLMRALEAGALNGQGDSRCTGDGIPSDSAFLRVNDARGNALIMLEARDTTPMNPLVSLRAQYDTWRAQHPCASSGSDAGTGDGGSLDAGSPDGAAPADASAPGITFPPSEALDAMSPVPAADATVSADAGNGASPAPTSAERDAEDGCSVRQSAEGSARFAGVLLALCVVLARRRRRGRHAD